MHMKLPPLDYLLYLPKQYDRNNAHWPLVIFLHGAGERGTTITEVAKLGPPRLISDGGHLPAILVSPQCPPERSWQPVLLLRLIDQVTAQYRVDTRRICVTGYSMGGCGTWGLAAAAPDRFAAAAPLCGGGDVPDAKELRNTPLWVFHGEVDDVVSLEASEKMVEAVKAAGGHVVFTVYPGEGHGICDRTYARDDFWKWLLSHQRPNSPGDSLNATGVQDGESSSGLATPQEEPLRKKVLPLEQQRD